MNMFYTIRTLYVQYVLYSHTR